MRLTDQSEGEENETAKTKGSDFLDSPDTGNTRGACPPWDHRGTGTIRFLVSRRRLCSARSRDVVQRTLKVLLIGSCAASLAPPALRKPSGDLWRKTNRPIRGGLDSPMT